MICCDCLFGCVFGLFGYFIMLCLLFGGWVGSGFWSCSYGLVFVVWVFGLFDVFGAWGLVCGRGLLTGIGLFLICGLWVCLLVAGRCFMVCYWLLFCI